MSLSERDCEIIATFLDQYESEFQQHLEDYEIDGSEAAVFIDDLRKAFVWMVTFHDRRPSRNTVKANS